MVGCEVAGNAADRLHKVNGCEKKKVILVHAGSHLLPRSKGHKYIYDYLVSLGVEIHLNQRIVEFDDMLQTYTSSSGEVFSAGKVYTCTGPRANTEALKDAQTDSVIQSAVDEKGFVKVDDHLRLHGAPNIFAVGDIVEGRMFPTTGPHVVTGKVAPERTADFSIVHAFTAGNNIMRSITGEPLVSINGRNNVHGQMLLVDMGPEKGVAVCSYELAEKFWAMGFDFGGDPEELKRDGASLSDKLPGVKAFGNSMVAKMMSDPDTHNMFWNMKGGYAEVIDPLARPDEEAKPDEEPKQDEEAPAAAEE